MIKITLHHKETSVVSGGKAVKYDTLRVREPDLRSGKRSGFGFRVVCRGCWSCTWSR